MRFSCSQSTLVKALNIVSKAVTSRTTIPILKGILINVDENGFVTMSASDLDISIENKFEVVDYEPGEIVVQAKLFSDIIRKLPSDIIYIEENEGNVLIKCSSSEFNIIGSPSDEFPKINLGSEGEKLVFDKEILKEMIKKTNFAASIDESRGVITGVLFEMKENSFNMVALDGFRMAVARENINNEREQNIIVPARTLNEVQKIISEADTEKEEVELILNDKRALFIIDNIKVVVRLLDGEYVKYNDIQRFHILIYDRRGQLVFESYDPEKSWDGKYQNGKKCPQGVYTYIISCHKITYPYDQIISKGTVLLLR